MRMWCQKIRGYTVNPLHIPCEADLLSTNDKTYADAINRCQHAGAYCAQDGYCHFNGDCFVNLDLTREQAIAEIDHLKSELEDARVKYRSMEGKYFYLIDRLDLAHKQALHNGHSERLFALRQCLGIMKKDH